MTYDPLTDPAPTPESWMTHNELLVILDFLRTLDPANPRRTVYLDDRDLNGNAPVPAGKMVRLTVELVDKGSPR